MKKSFAHGLGDLAGDDIRRWRADRPLSDRSADPRDAGLRHVIETLMAAWRCRRPMRRAFALHPALVFDPSSTHVHIPPHRPR